MADNIGEGTENNGVVGGGAENIGGGAGGGVKLKSKHTYLRMYIHKRQIYFFLFRCEERTAIRIKVLDVLCKILEKFSPLYEVRNFVYFVSHIND